MTKDQNADASKKVTDCQSWKDIADDFARQLCEMQSEKDKMWDIAHTLHQENITLKEAINSAISYLACMDRISEDKPNEQLAMDVLNNALGEKK